MSIPYKHSLCIPAILIAFICTFTAFTGRAQISTATITVNDSSSITLPAPATAAASPAAFCTGSSTTLTVSNGHLGTGAYWIWTEGSCNGDSVGTGTTLVVSPTNTGTTDTTITYYVHATGTCNTTGCVSVTVTVHPTPAITAPANQVVCNGAVAPALSLTGIPSNVTYSISGGATIGLADASGLTEIPSFTAVNTGTSAVTGTITVTPSANGCTGTAIVYTVTVLPTVTVNSIANVNACNNTTTAAIAFTSPSTGGDITYTWANTNTSIGLPATGTGDIAAFTVANTSDHDTTATITVTPHISAGASPACDGTPVTFTITVHPSPNGTISAVNNAICEGTQIQLEYTSVASGSIAPYELHIAADGTSSPVTYSNIQAGTAFDVTPTPTASGSHTYNLMYIQDGNGCILQ